MSTTAFVCGSVSNWLQHIDKRLADNRVAADADHGALPDTGPGQLIHNLVGEGTAPGYDTDIARA